MSKNLKVNRMKDGFEGKYIPTGSVLLDLACSGHYPNGGIGRGKITHIYGGFSTMKTVMAQEILGSTQRLGGTSIFVDREYSFDFSRACLFGLDVGKWEDEKTQVKAIEIEKKADEAKKNKREKHKEAVEKIIGMEKNFALLHTNSVEDFFEEIINVVCSLDIPKPVCVVLDSMTALPSVVDINDELDKDSYNAARAKRIGNGYRKYLTAMNDNDVSLVVIDQTRDKLGGMGKKHTTSGGRSLDFYASSKIYLKHSEHIKNKNDIDIGIGVRAELEKNKIYKPRSVVPLKVLWDIGIDDVTCNLEWLSETGVECKLEKAGSWYSWGEKRIGQGLENSVKFIEDNEMWDEVEQEVYRVWQEVNKSPDRVNRHFRKKGK